jgi:tRNA (guanine-N7-)-methyltransferase
MQRGALIFVKTDVQDLFEYMDFTILSNLKFQKIEKRSFNYSNSFNPIKIQTNREKYVQANQLDVFERIYEKI